MNQRWSCSTIHSAKGLEFDSVFILQALEGSLPSSYSLADDEAIDEELRLFYVAITRAKRNLFITYPAVKYRRGYGDYFAEPTRFVNGLGDDVLEKWEIVAQSSAGSPPALLPPPLE